MTNYFVRYLLLLLPTILISCKDGFDKELEREAKDFTTNRCPIEVESGTTLDSLTYDPNRRIYTSYYSLNGTNEPFYSSNAPLLHQMLLQRLKSSADYKDIKASLCIPLIKALMPFKFPGHPPTNDTSETRSSSVSSICINLEQVP